jgi:hypothetical protein
MNQEPIRTRALWAVRTLQGLGIRDVRPPQRVRRLPWSLVAPITTADGVFYLKYVRGAFLQEPALTRALHALAPDHVPDLVASDTDLACWITRDAGDAFLPSMEPDAGLSVLDGLLARHAALQRMTLGQPDDWLGRGAKDVRPNRFGPCLDEVLAAGPDLARDGVGPDTLSALNAARPRLASLAAELEALNPPCTVTHMDLRLGNIRRSRGAARLIDWGDAGYGPAFLDLVPLFSELATGRTTAGHVDDLRTAALGRWSGHGTAGDREQAHRLCRIAYPMLYAHGLIHARPTGDPDMDPSHHGLLRFYLNTFLGRLDGAP